MERPLKVAVVALGAAMLVPLSGAYAWADDPPPAVDGGAVITSTEPSVLSNTAAVPTGTQGDSAIDARVNGSEIVVPTDPSDGVSLTSPTGVEVSVGLPFADNADAPAVVKSGAVSIDNNNGSATVPVVKQDGSIAINTVITDAEAPTRYSYPVTLPAGGHLELGTDGTVAIIAADGTFVGGVAPAWAKDVNDKPVPTHFEIDGGNLVQVVEHQGAGVAYPVVADPWFGFSLIDRVSWVTTRQGRTAQVYPTFWGRTTGAAARWSAWSEAKKKGGSAIDRPNLEDQFYCHFDVVRDVSPTKPSWNLDTWRPHVGYWATVRAQCNP